MKHLTLTLLFFALFLSGKAQTDQYIPYPTDTAMWYFTIQASTGPSYYSLIMGDTAINGKVYNKFLGGNLTYKGGIRQDIPNEKTYLIDLNDVEHDISINQHLNVGDTLKTSDAPLGYPFSFGSNNFLIVESIDSLKIGEEFRKQFSFNVYENQWNEVGVCSYVCGVGFTYHLIGISSSTKLTCFTNNYPDLLIGGEQLPINPACNFLSTNEKEKQPAFQVYPNPTTDKVFVELNQGQHGPVSIKLINALGQTVRSQSFAATQQIEVELGSTSGLYVLEIETGDFKQYLKVLKE